MKNPITTVREKIEAHKVAIAYISGSVVGSTIATASCIYTMKKLGWEPPVKHPLRVQIPLAGSVDEIKEMLDKAKALDITNPLNGDVLTLFTTDFKP